ncbi:MAG: metallophosphoesterase [Clostridia bacterium]|nr:metallophosphoesterase [Clostridia bacterium]
MKLRFREENGQERFSVLVVHGFADEKNACLRLGAMLDEAEPDLLLFLGDTVRAPGTDRELRDALDRLTAPASERGIPFAFCFGDRDLRSAGIGSGEMSRIWREYPLCVSGSGENGVDVLTVSDAAGDTAALRLWCLDSHEEIGGYEAVCGSPTKARLAKPLYTKYYMDGVRFSQTVEYDRREEVFAAQEGTPAVPGVMFFHTPCPEFSIAVMNAVQTMLRGNVEGIVRCSTVNGGIFSAAAERHNVKAIVCGHDGGDCYAARYCGMELVKTPAVGSTSGDGMLLTLMKRDSALEISAKVITSDGRGEHCLLPR